MSKNLYRYKQLTVISDTALIKKDSSIFGFGPVVRELEYIAPNFEKIVWVGFERPNRSDTNTFDRINDKRIETVFLKRCGGDRLWDKIKILINMPRMTLTIIKHISKAQVVHTRAPSAPAFIAVLLSYIFRKKIWWNKYAGNWKQENPPFFYGLQRKLFTAAGHTNVTINGFWEDQPKHCFSFENPCLTAEDISEGKQIQSRKEFNAPFRLTFIGRIEKAKGVHRIIEALKDIDLNMIERIDFIGDGVRRKEFEESASFMEEKAVFHGFVDKKGVHDILSESHFLLLPSDSEGFPKVIAEAACYGCIPVVSEVSSIGHYINDETNGFLWKVDGTETFHEILEKALHTPSLELKRKSNNVIQMASLFSFENYKDKLEKFFLKDK